MRKLSLSSCLLLAAGACVADEGPDYATGSDELSIGTGIILPDIELTCSTLDEVVADLTASGVAIGALVTPERSFVDGTRFREYEHAVVARAPDGCGVSLTGPLFERWSEEGSLKPTTIYTSSGTLYLYNQLGPPRGGMPLTTPRVGELARFDNARMYWTASTGAVVVKDAHVDEYVRQGGHRGWLGFPTADTDDFVSGWGESSVTDFENGSIFADQRFGDDGTPRLTALGTAWSDKWFALGGPKRPPFDWPAGSATYWTDGSTTLPFEAGGEMIHNPATGLFALHGPILARWKEWGYLGSFLGLPTSDTGTTRAGTPFTHFQHGSLYDHPVHDIYWVDVPMREKWAFLGWEWGWLGYPVGWPVDGIDGGRFQPFDGGYMYTHAGATFPIPYADRMQEGFWAAGAEYTVGYPIADVVACGGSQNGHYQDFGNGVITSNYNGASTPTTSYRAGRKGGCDSYSGWACGVQTYEVCYPDGDGGELEYHVEACSESDAIAKQRASGTWSNPDLFRVGDCRGPGSGTSTPGTGSTCDEAGEACCGESCMGDLECNRTRNECYLPCDTAGGCGEGDTEIPGPEIPY